MTELVRVAYQYPLFPKQLWHTPLLQSPDQEIVHRDGSSRYYH